jgi:hypothetical protein
MAASAVSGTKLLFQVGIFAATKEIPTRSGFFVFSARTSGTRSSALPYTRFSWNSGELLLPGGSGSCTETSICSTVLKSRCFLAVAFDTIPP